VLEPDNRRSHRLLIRVGFTRTDEPERLLSAFLPGDDTFVQRA
jgi:RimJ/RimL family protein N-acetyltransferase